MSGNGNGIGVENGNGHHSREQGLRVHHLANLGGLIALAGLDLEPPDFLLGALLSVAQEARKLRTEQRARVASIGKKKLDQRATGKRAWKSWTRAQDLHAITLSTTQVREIIEVLGGRVPEEPTRLALALSQALTEACDETD
ncbi:MAG: conjugal transfer protein TraD [Candidatus Binataceae bacterium]